MPNVNPDLNRRPSPVVFRLYELKSLAAFPMDFFALSDKKDKETLGADLVAREEFQLYPGKQLKLELKLDPDTRYIGAIAAFRDWEKGQWRATMAVVPHKTTAVEIRLDESRVTMTAP